MKSYRCVFSYSGGNTTIDISAEDGERAVDAAAAAINAGDYDRVEVWDGETVVIERTTPRAWDALGDGSAPNVQTSSHDTEQPPAASPLALGLPRRAPTLFASGLRTLGLGGKGRRPRTASRKPEARF